MSEKAFEKLLSYREHDPHSILGAHASGTGALVRAYRPGAMAVRVVHAGKDYVAQDSAGRGLWQAALPSMPGPGYRVVASYAGASDWDCVDGYAFAPTLGELDLHLFGEGRHHDVWKRLGAHSTRHQEVDGVAFSLWAPGVESVSVVGDFNLWDGRLHAMRSLGGGGVWELFIPGVSEGALYKFELRPRLGPPFIKSDPYAQATEIPPSTASKVTTSRHVWKDEAWVKARAQGEVLRKPLSVYELHLGSWRRVPEEGDRSLTYREAAVQLADYCVDLGFTHVELMPIAEHPFGPSWGYQVGNYYAPTARYGSPDDLRAMVDALHQKGLGVILDWVPAHFPKDAYALARFTGDALYEHLDPRQGEHPDWGTYIFNFGRKEVCNFLLANALYWLDEFHIDGLRIDAVASMLYLDYSRKAGEWVPNQHGGRENLEAIAFLKRVNEETHLRFPGTMILAEESTAWPGVSRPTTTGGLGFTYKWNMGWMHDTLEYFSKDPIHRKWQHHNLTFGFLYAWSENFVLPLSHDEVVHGKGSLLTKMPGDRWQKFANLRALYTHMWAHPGKKLLFMGCEIGQWNEWKHDSSVDWHLLMGAEHSGLQRLIRDLNKVYRATPALYDNDVEAAGFAWIESTAGDDNMVAFIRRARDPRQPQVVCVGNFSPVPRPGYRVGVPHGGPWHELINSDLGVYGGSSVANGTVYAEEAPWQGQPFSVVITLPPLGVVWLGPGN